MNYSMVDFLLFLWWLWLKIWDLLKPFTYRTLKWIFFHKWMSFEICDCWHYHTILYGCIKLFPNVMYYSYALSYCLSKYWSCWIWKELKRLMAYAGSSANLLTKLILEDHSDSYRWEVSLTNLSVLCTNDFTWGMFWYFGLYKLLKCTYWLAVPFSNSFEQLWCCYSSP